VLSVSLSTSGSVVSVRLLVCASSKSVGQALGMCCRSKCGFMLSVCLSVKLWIYAVGYAVGLCCR
jgi:hypothetical protein